jgi:hypothetical protein
MGREEVAVNHVPANRALCVRAPRWYPLKIYIYIIGIPHDRYLIAGDYGVTRRTVQTDGSQQQSQSAKRASEPCWLGL